MKVSSIDIDVFQDAPDGTWFTVASLSEGFRGIDARLKRMISLGLIEQNTPPNEHTFRKLAVTDTCSKCDWVGTEDQMAKVPDLTYTGISVTDNVCPKCACKSFYRLV